MNPNEKTMPAMDASLLDRALAVGIAQVAQAQGAVQDLAGDGFLGDEAERPRGAGQECEAAILEPPPQTCGLLLGKKKCCPTSTHRMAPFK